MAKTLKPLIDHAVAEALLGNYGPLIGRVMSSDLTPAEKKIIWTVLELSTDKRGRAALHQIEQAMIALDVEELIETKGMSKTAAVIKIMEARNLSRSAVWDALAKYKSNKFG